MEKKKNFIYPEAIIISFDDEDIILTSGPDDPEGQDYDDWYGGNN